MKVISVSNLESNYQLKNPTNLRPILEPKKQFGQNFLVNPAMQRKIAEHMGVLVDKYPLAAVVEIGPGQGDLTQYLLDFQRIVIALEIDPQALAVLQQKFGQVANLRLMQADALELLTKNPGMITQLLTLSQGPDSQAKPNDDATFILLSNLPFNVGSRILVELPVYYPHTPFAVILQREVANKTRTGSDFTFFGAWLNLFWDLTVEFQIAPGNFYPVPKVYSSLLVGWPRQLPEWLSTPERRTRAKNLLKTLCRQPRKTILNNLKNTVFASLGNQLAANQRLGWENYQTILSTAYDLQYRS